MPDALRTVDMGLSKAGKTAVDFRCYLMVCLDLVPVKASGLLTHSKDFARELTRY